MKTKQLKREEERSAKKGRTLQNTHQNYEVNYDRKTTDRTRHGHLTSHPRLDGRSCSQTQWKEICRDKHRAIQLGFSRSLLDMDLCNTDSSDVSSGFYQYIENDESQFRNTQKCVQLNYYKMSKTGDTSANENHRSDLSSSPRAISQNENMILKNRQLNLLVDIPRRSNPPPVSKRPCMRRGQLHTYAMQPTEKRTEEMKTYYHVAHGTPHRIRSFHRSPSPPCSHSSCYQATRSRNVRFNKLADSPNLTPNRTKKITQFTFLTSSCITKQSPRCRYTIRQGSLRDDMNPNKNQA